MKQGPAADGTVGEAFAVADLVAEVGRSVLFRKAKRHASEDLAAIAPTPRQTSVAISEEAQAWRYPGAEGNESHTKGTA